MEKDQKKVWAKRAEKYNNLEWTSKIHMLDQILSILNPKEDDLVLDAGCGTGAIIKKIKSIVKEAHGLDLSKEMLDQIDTSNSDNIKLTQSSIADMEFSDYFDKIIARMVFHHILTEEERVASIKKCHKALKKGGRMIISEGVPPHECLKDDYEKIFSLKEERVIFLEQDIEDLMKQGGFNKVHTYLIIDKGMSIRNWLVNDGTLTEETIKEIMDLHINSSDIFKKLYDLKRTEDGDMLIDVKVAIVVGEK